jgi:hypothetical protein
MTLPVGTKVIVRSDSRRISTMLGKRGEVVGHRDGPLPVVVRLFERVKVWSAFKPLEGCAREHDTFGFMESELQVVPGARAE